MYSFFKNNTQATLFGIGALYYYPANFILIPMIYLAYLAYAYSNRMEFYYGPTEVLSNLTNYIKMVPNPDVNQQGQAISILESGASFSFAMCYAALHTQNERLWWEDMLVAVANWDGKEESLSKNINLRNPTNKNGITLRQAFERVLHYIISNQYLPQNETLQHQSNQRFFTIQNNFEILDKIQKVRKICCIDRASGYLSENNLAELLHSKDQVNAICLVENMDQTVAITSLSSGWLLYNPDSSHLSAEKMHQVFATKQDLSKAIVDLLGNHLVITLLHLADKKERSRLANVFRGMLVDKPTALLENDGLMLMVKDGHTQILEDVLMQFKHDKNFANKLLSILSKRNSTGWTGFQLILANRPTLLPKILDIIENSNDISKKILLMLKTQDPNGWNGYQTVMVYAHTLFPRLLKLLSKNMPETNAEKAAFESDVNKELVTVESYFSTIAWALYIDSFINTDGTIYIGQSIVLFNLSLYLMLNNDTQEVSADLEKLIKSFKEGHCYGLSVCHAAMRAYGSLEWWESLLVAVAQWEGDLAALNKNVVLRGAVDPTPVSLESLFKKMICYVGFHQNHDESSETQLRQLVANFEMIDKEGNVRKIEDIYTAVGHFTKMQILQLLNQDDFKNAMCIISNVSHAITINHQDDNTWLIYDPNYSHKLKKYIHKIFKTKEELVTELLAILGHNLSISLLYSEKRPTPPNMTQAYKRMQNESSDLLASDGLYLVAHANNDLALAMLRQAKINPSFPEQLLMTLETKVGKLNTFTSFIIFNPILLPTILDILSASNKAPDAILELLAYRDEEGIPTLSRVITHAKEHLEKLVLFVQTAKDAPEKIKKLLPKEDIASLTIPRKGI